MSETPRTDAAAYDPSHGAVSATAFVDFARDLERENAAMREALTFPPPKGTLYGDPETIALYVEAVRLLTRFRDDVWPTTTALQYTRPMCADDFADDVREFLGRMNPAEGDKP